MLRLSIISTFVSQFTEFTEGKIVFLRFTKYLKIKKCFSSSVDPALRTCNTQNRSWGGGGVRFSINRYQYGRGIDFINFTSLKMTKNSKNDNVHRRHISSPIKHQI